MDGLDFINKESGKTCTLLGFLIEQPQLSTSLIGIDKKMVYTKNYVRLVIAEMWIKAMKKEVAEKFDNKNDAKKLDELKKYLESS